ncbi:MAG: hypothetical protein R3E79_32030 [Caldilineaceae bacterium]
MIYQEQVAKKVQALPDSLVRVVDLFIDFLLLRYRQTPVTDDLNSELLTQMAAAGGAFDWLTDPAEDGIYSDADGEPV